MIVYKTWATLTKIFGLQERQKAARGALRLELTGKVRINECRRVFFGGRKTGRLATQVTRAARAAGRGRDREGGLPPLFDMKYRSVR
jgi:hypothetical protein